MSTRRNWSPKWCQDKIVVLVLEAQVHVLEVSNAPSGLEVFVVLELAAQVHVLEVSNAPSGLEVFVVLVLAAKVHVLGV